MIAIISSTKSLDFEKKLLIEEITEPIFTEEVNALVNVIKEYTVDEIAKMMKISDKLAEVNYDRFKYFYEENINARQALFAFSGEVYRAINPFTYEEEDINFAQEHIRILSGLFGMLRPLDKIKEYRLEMATKIKDIPENNLYNFWTDKITEKLVSELKHRKEKTILNLASLEYSKVINRNKLENIEVYDVEFKEDREGKFKVIGTYAKRARGLMVTYVVKKKINCIEEVKGFNEEGYKYNEELSTTNKLIFTR